MANRVSVNITRPLKSIIDLHIVMILMLKINDILLKSS